MHLDKMTRKSQEAMQAAADYAENHKHSAVEPEHLLFQLMSQEDGVVPQVAKELGVSLSKLQAELEGKLKALPEVSGASVRVVASPSLVKVFNGAEGEARNMGDSYISTEHFILSMYKGHTPELARLLEKNGLSQQVFLTGLEKVRGSQKVTDDNPESKYDSLGKYARDLTALAEQGKLDPVVGRDEEIRRVVQVLSRRTKNNPVLIGEPGVDRKSVV